MKKEDLQALLHDTLDEVSILPDSVNGMRMLVILEMNGVMVVRHTGEVFEEYLPLLQALIDTAEDTEPEILQ